MTFTETALKGSYVIDLKLLLMIGVGLPELM